MAFALGKASGIEAKQPLGPLILNRAGHHFND
jgi:hypothetical protein